MSVYSAVDSTGSRPATMSPGGSIRSCATGHSLSNDCGTGDNNSKTGSDQSRFSRVRKPKKRIEGRVRAQNKMREGRDMTDSESVEGFTGGRPGTMSTGGSRCSGSTGRSLGGDCDTGDDGPDTGSDTRFELRFSRAKSAHTLNSQHASTSIYPNVTARRELDSGPQENRRKRHEKMIEGRIREQNKMTEDRNREHQGIVDECRRKQQLSQVPSCLDSMVSNKISRFIHPAGWKGETTGREDSSSEHSPYWAREAVDAEADMSLFDPSYCGCHFSKAGQVEPLHFDDAVGTEWGFLRQGMPPANQHKDPPGETVASGRESVPRVGQSEEGVAERSSRGVVTVAE